MTPPHIKELMIHMGEQPKEIRIRKEINRLKKLLKDISPDKLKAADGLIRRTAFMQTTLEDLEEDINAKGTIEKFSQTENIEYERERPATRIYNTTIKNYAAACKQLFDLIPESKKVGDGPDELMGFLKKGAKK